MQGVFSALMEHVILHSKTSDLRMKQLKFPTSLRKELQRYTQLLLHTLMKHMVPSAFFMGITKLLRHVDDNLRKKVGNHSASFPFFFLSIDVMAGRHLFLGYLFNV